MSPRNRSEQIQRLDPAIAWPLEIPEVGTISGKRFAGAYNLSTGQVRVSCHDYGLSYANVGMESTGYLVTLHELGHKCSPNQPDWTQLSDMGRMLSVYTPKDRLLIVLAEIDAWQWAVDHSLTPIGADDVYMICQVCLGSYFGNTPAHVMRRKIVRDKYQQLVTTLERRQLV